MIKTKWFEQQILQFKHCQKNKQQSDYITIDNEKCIVRIDPGILDAMEPFANQDCDIYFRTDYYSVSYNYNRLVELFENRVVD